MTCDRMIDLRGTCTVALPAIPPKLIEVVAVTDGILSKAHPHMFVLRAGSKTNPDLKGLRFHYLHMNSAKVFKTGAETYEVIPGEVIGYVWSIDRNGNQCQTTAHLHFEIVGPVGSTSGLVSPYLALIAAYEKDRKIKALLVR
jgi:murein DD-endopeptidase MepM/ murein hydrolase activator NlpD